VVALAGRGGRRRRGRHQVAGQGARPRSSAEQHSPHGSPRLGDKPPGSRPMRWTGSDASARAARDAPAAQKLTIASAQAIRRRPDLLVGTHASARGRRAADRGWGIVVRRLSSTASAYASRGQLSRPKGRGLSPTCWS
jgi:hypothetical protein